MTRKFSSVAGRPTDPPFARFGSFSRSIPFLSSRLIRTLGAGSVTPLRGEIPPHSYLLHLI